MLNYWVDGGLVSTIGTRKLDGVEPPTSAFENHNDRILETREMMEVNSLPDFVALARDTNKAHQRVSECVEAFRKEFGTLPTHVVRNPGRVNLIGEHIDYMGYGVLPMAIEADCMICVGPSSQLPEHTLSVRHLVAASHTPRDISVPDWQPEAITVDPSQHHWSNYVMAGVRGALSRAGPGGAKGLRSLGLLVHGTVPQSAGLSSSSALVSAAVLATASVLQLNLKPGELAEVAQTSEVLVGTAGGGMDQAISFLAQKGVAQRIDFNPIRAAPVHLPQGAVFVVSNSLVEASKAITAHTQFNKRVVECRLGCAIAARELGLSPEAIAEYAATTPKHTYYHLQTLAGMKDDIDAFRTRVLGCLKEGTYSAAEVASALGITESEVATTYLEVGGRQVSGPFAIRQRADHVLSEASRVIKFHSVCGNTTLDDQSKAKALGELMNLSHESCRDLYECSCPELDTLTDTARSLGSLGSRLTGAGWGGCCVSLVASESLETFLQGLWDAYFVPLLQAGRAFERNDVLFATTAAQGGSVYQLS